MQNFVAIFNTSLLKILVNIMLEINLALDEQQMKPSSSGTQSQQSNVFYINTNANFEQNKPLNWLQSLFDTLLLDCFSLQMKIICSDFLTKPSLWKKILITSLCIMVPVSNFVYRCQILVSNCKHVERNRQGISMFMSLCFFLWASIRYTKHLTLAQSNLTFDWAGGLHF